MYAPRGNACSTVSDRLPRKHFLGAAPTGAVTPSDPRSGGREAARETLAPGLGAEDGRMGLPHESRGRSRFRSRSNVHTPRPHLRKSLATGARDLTRPTLASPGDTSQETSAPRVRVSSESSR